MSLPSSKYLNSFPFHSVKPSVVTTSPMVPSLRPYTVWPLLPLWPHLLLQPLLLLQLHCSFFSSNTHPSTIQALGGWKHGCFINCCILWAKNSTWPIRILTERRHWMNDETLFHKYVLLHIEYQAQHLPDVKPSQKLWKQALFSPWCRWGSWIPGRFYFLFQVTQLDGGNTEVFH